MAIDPIESLNVPLDPSLFEFVREQASAAGYANPADYVSQLIETARRLHSSQQLEAALVQGLESGTAGPVTKRDWEKLRNRARDRDAARERGA